MTPWVIACSAMLNSVNEASQQNSVIGRTQHHFPVQPMARQDAVFYERARDLWGRYFWRNQNAALYAHRPKASISRPGQSLRLIHVLVKTQCALRANAHKSNNLYPQIIL